VAENDPDRRYQIHEFAVLAGVTVRTLHHYDRVGLLRPRRAANGYRLYRELDLVRLEQIVALKFLGLPLRRIRALLDRDGTGLAGALEMQRTVLESRRVLLNQAIDAIREAENMAKAGARPAAALLRKIIEVIEMQNSSEWTTKYYSDAAQQKLAALRQDWSPELQERISREWLDLIGDVQAALGEDPAGDKAQELAGRWMGLVEQFTGGDAEIAGGLGKLWADKQNWPSEAKQQAEPFRITPEVWAFIHQAIAVRKQA